MKFVYLALNWTFGILFLLSGIASSIESPLVGLTFILMAMFFLPPSRNFVYSKTNKELSIKVKSVVILVLFLISVVFITQDQSSKRQELIAQQAQEKLEKEGKVRQEKTAYYKANREQIISTAKEAFLIEDYQSVVSLAHKYSVVKDKELENIYANAQKELSIIEREKKTKEILATLKTTPSKEYEKNKVLYQQLVTLNPTINAYKKKFDYYQTKITEQQEKARIAKIKLQKEVKALVGQKVPYKKWTEWGSPETLKGTSNKYWAAYLPTANISFVSEKKTDIIIFSGFNKNSAQNFVAQQEAKKWYEKGTLHKSTIEEWKHSTHENKIATSGDWILSIAKNIKSKVENSGNIDSVKPYCEELVICIDGAVEGHKNWDKGSTSETAISCMALMGWLK